jgi:hypothetical protein
MNGLYLIRTGRSTWPCLQLCWSAIRASLTDRWWEVKQEQEQAAAEHAAREEKEQQAKALGA